jgi:hypothetical protein
MQRILIKLTIHTNLKYNTDILLVILVLDLRRILGGKVEIIFNKS